jgi:hypothetical protein
VKDGPHALSSQARYLASFVKRFFFLVICFKRYLHKFGAPQNWSLSVEMFLIEELVLPFSFEKEVHGGGRYPRDKAT